MLTSKTVFILGAGESQEAGLPLGGELAMIIANNMDYRVARDEQPISGDWDFLSAVGRKTGLETNVLLQAAARIRDGIYLANSIDDFLDIASFRDSWFVKFMKLLGRGANPENLFNDVAFVVFNYDRCLEQFLWHAVERLYGLPPNKTRETFSKATIFHPYGAIGPIPQIGSQDSVPFGGNNLNDYVGLASRIRTYTEEAESREIHAIHGVLAAADRLVFLGFAFHRQNLDLLMQGGKLAVPHNVYATTDRFSTDDRQVIRDRIFQMLASGNVHDQPLKCNQLLDHYRLTLAA
jgi:hypothetical protein